MSKEEKRQEKVRKSKLGTVVAKEMAYVRFSIAKDGCKTVTVKVCLRAPGCGVVAVRIRCMPRRAGGLRPLPARS